MFPGFTSFVPCWSVSMAKSSQSVYYGSDPTEYSDLQSVTKSIVSTLVGIAIGESAITSVDATLEDLLPDIARTWMTEREGRPFVSC